MIYAKHPQKGNKYFPDSERCRIEADGWIVWPRSKAQKSPSKVAAPQVTPEVVSSPRSALDPDGAAPEKRPIGRPPKG